ncbi:MAG: hypothetical protein ACMUJM_25245 [bacterium]
MNDTHPGIKAEFQRLMKMKSNEERLLMGCSMYDTAKMIVKSAILNKEPKIDAESLREKIFLHFYGIEFDENEKRNICKALRHYKRL